MLVRALHRLFSALFFSVPLSGNTATIDHVYSCSREDLEACYQRMLLWQNEVEESARDRLQRIADEYT